MDRIIPIFFLLLVIGIRVAFYIVEQPTREAAFQAENIPTVIIYLPEEHTMNEYMNLKSGMTLSQVIDVFNVAVPEKRAEMEEMVKSPECLVKFKNPSKSGYWVVFREGKVSTKTLYDAAAAEKLERGY